MYKFMPVFVDFFAVYSISSINPFFGYMIVNLICDLRRFMSHEILQYLHIHAILCISGTSGMSENVWG